MKSEPDAYALSDLKKDGSTLWDGIRNYQARNFMRSMRIGDLAFFYHSNCKPPGIVGLMEVIKTKEIDPTQFTKESKYFDPKSSPENPRWMMVDIEPVYDLKSVTLPELRSNGDLEGMPLLRKGQRLSVQPVSKQHFSIVCNMGGLENNPL